LFEAEVLSLITLRLLRSTLGLVDSISTLYRAR
jgi:hypothetical protein